MAAGWLRRGAGDRWFGTVRRAGPLCRGVGTLWGAWLLRRRTGGRWRGRSGWLRWSGPGRPGWTGFRQAAALIRTVALGNVTVIHGVHLPDRIWGPSFCRAFPARRDIFATWMARSSFSARSGRTKGFRAWKRASCRSSPPICLDICRKP